MAKNTTQKTTTSAPANTTGIDVKHLEATTLANGTMAVQTKEIETSMDVTNGILILNFRNGETLKVVVHDLKPEVAQHAILHGLKQKLVDAAAMARDEVTGRSATLEQKYAAVKAVHERLTIDGLWNAVRKGGGNNEGTILVQALLRHFAGRKTPEQIKEWVAAKSPAEVAALKASPAIKAHIDAINADKAASTGIDADKLLDELM